MSKQSVWDGLDRFGFSEKAKTAIMGNMGPESGFISTNVEDRYTGSDLAYTAAVDNGSYSRDSFALDNGKYYGYGLCQWTYPTRKMGLYDLAKGRGVSIGDEPMQLDFLWQELHTPEFAGVLEVLQSDASLREMTEKFLVTFENPTDKSQSVKNYRVSIAEQIFSEFTGKGKEPEVERFWPPRGARGGKDDPGLCKGMNGPDVAVLQALLKARGYTLSGTAGVFGDSTDSATRKFQRDNGLVDDGIAGPKTWAEIIRI